MTPSTRCEAHKLAEQGAYIVCIVTMASALEQGRTAYDRQKWAAAYSHLSAADRESPLAPEDLERLGTAAYLVGKDAEGLDLLVRLHNEYLKVGQTRPAVRAAFWLGF